MSKILCVDFDGVIHSYTSGWQGADVIPDPPVPGALEWLADMFDNPDYDVKIYSSRSKSDAGVDAMIDWLNVWLDLSDIDTDDLFPTQKPPTYLTIDDRAICFRGTFPSVQEMDNFKPWNK